MDETTKSGLRERAHDGIIYKSRVKKLESPCPPRGTAGMDEATIVGLRERVHSGRPPYGTGFMNNAGLLNADQIRSR
jgi:hypothetical protein